MNRTKLVILTSAILVALSMAACSSDGKLANKDKPFDKQVTLTAVCSGIVKANEVFQTLAATLPGVIDQNGMDFEGALLDTVGLSANVSPPKPPRPGSVCASPYAGDLNVALNAAITASVNITKLLATWNK